MAATATSIDDIDLAVLRRFSPTLETTLPDASERRTFARRLASDLDAESIERIVGETNGKDLGMVERLTIAVAGPATDAG